MQKIFIDTFLKQKVFILYQNPGKFSSNKHPRQFFYSNDKVLLINNFEFSFAFLTAVSCDG